MQIRANVHCEGGPSYFEDRTYPIEEYCAEQGDYGSQYIPLGLLLEDDEVLDPSSIVNETFDDEDDVRVIIGRGPQAFSLRWEGRPETPQKVFWEEAEEVSEEASAVSVEKKARKADDGWLRSMDFENFGMNNLLEMDIKRASKMQMAHQDDDAWEEMYTKLVIFKDTHGHVNVPPNYTEADNLAPWLSLQRMLWRIGQLSRDRQQKLESLGVFHPDWETSFNALSEFKSIEGHTDVPVSYPKDPDLGVWVVGQRQERKAETLSVGKVEKLDSIGFTWESPEEREMHRDGMLGGPMGQDSLLRARSQLMLNEAVSRTTSGKHMGEFGHSGIGGGTGAGRGGPGGDGVGGRGAGGSGAGGSSSGGIGSRGGPSGTGKYSQTGNNGGKVAGKTKTGDARAMNSMEVLVAEELRAAKQLFLQHAGFIWNLFTYYCTAFTVGYTGMTSMGSNQFIEFCKETKILSGPMKQAELDLVFVRSQIHNNALMTATGGGNSRGNTANDKVLHIEEFMITLCRLANTKYKDTYYTLSERLQHLLERDIIPNARPTIKELKKKLMTPLTSAEVSDVLEKHRRRLHKIFKGYLIGKERKKPLHLARLFFEGFLTMAKSRDLVGESVSHLLLRSIYILASSTSADETLLGEAMDLDEYQFRAAVAMLGIHLYQNERGGDSLKPDSDGWGEVVENFLKAKIFIFED